MSNKADNKKPRSKLTPIKFSNSPSHSLNSLSGSSEDEFDRSLVRCCWWVGVPLAEAAVAVCVVVVEDMSRRWIPEIERENNSIIDIPAEWIDRNGIHSIDRMTFQRDGLHYQFLTEVASFLLLIHCLSTFDSANSLFNSDEPVAYRPGGYHRPAVDFEQRAMLQHNSPKHQRISIRSTDWMELSSLCRRRHNSNDIVTLSIDCNRYAYQPKVM